MTQISNTQLFFIWIWNTSAKISKKNSLMYLLLICSIKKHSLPIKSLIHCLQRQLCICSFVVLFSSPLLIIRWIIDWCAKSLLLGAHKWPQGNRIIRFYYCRDRAILLLIDIDISYQTFVLNITEKKCFIRRCCLNVKWRVNNKNLSKQKQDRLIRRVMKKRKTCA